MSRAPIGTETVRFVADLLGYMTLEEKLGQLDLFHAADDPALEQAVVAGRVAGVLGGAHAERWQGLATERSRLGIPLLLTCLPGAPALSPWALAASWDEALAHDLGARAARDAIARRCNTISAPRFAAKGRPVGPCDIATCDAHLAAQLAAGFCRGAAHGTSDALADPQQAVLALAQRVTCEGAEETRAAVELAQTGAAAAIDCASLERSVAERSGFSGILVAECARIRTQIARQFATTRAPSRLEAAERAMSEGLLREEEIEAAVRGVLIAKHGLGLFRHPQRLFTSGSGSRDLERPAERLRATMVLLRNESGLLPLSPVSDRVLVVGPPDGAATACAEALERAGIAHSCVAGLALRAIGEPWSEPAQGDYFALALARDAAKRADFGVVVLDERHFVEAASPAPWHIPGEPMLTLLSGLASVGARLVAVVATAEPVDLAGADQYFAAVLQCWAPGEGFEEALGDILSGRAGPQGRMPAGAGRYPFGHGLSFGESVLSHYKLAAADGHVAASVKVRNTGSFFTARETVQVYVRDTGDALRLVAFDHATLEPGEEKTVAFELSLGALGTLGPSGRYELAPGQREVMVGKDQRRLLSATVEVPPALARAIVNRDRGFLRLAG